MCTIITVVSQSTTARATILPELTNCLNLCWNSCECAGILVGRTSPPARMDSRLVFIVTFGQRLITRPISLIGSIYKIVAKILANRIIRVLDDIVNEVQSAFIAERQMLGNRLASGLKINMSKSKILGIHVEDVKVKQAASKLGCLILNTHFSYLGYEGRGVICRGFHAWDEVVEKVTSRLSRWKMKTLSIGGRLTLLKSVLGSMPIFHMSIFKVPSSVLQRLESIRSRFFKGHDLGSNKASGLLFKWVWKFYAQKTSGVDGKVGKAINSGASSCWTSIVREVEVLKQQGVNFFEYLQLNMGNGESTTFWEDRRLEGSVLKDIFPRLYVLETNKKVSVGDKLKERIFGWIVVSSES
ncbi:hypothetical protein Tco_1189312 [Tanacetum coccineum]